MFTQVVMLWLYLVPKLLEKASRLVGHMRPRCRYGQSNVVVSSIVWGLLLVIRAAEARNSASSCRDYCLAIALVISSGR